MMSGTWHDRTLSKIHTVEKCDWDKFPIEKGFEVLEYRRYLFIDGKIVMNNS